MLLRVSLFLLMASVAAVPLWSQEWQPMAGTENFWIKENASFVPQDGSERGFSFDALRFDRIDYAYEILHMAEILRDAYPEVTNDYIVFDEQADASRVVRPSMKEAWNYLSSDESVVALVPIGFSEVAGEPSIAGFRKRDGAIENGIFAAPNLDAILCLDDVDEHQNRASKGLAEYPGQIPFLFPVEYSRRVTYQYLEDFDSVNLGTSYNSNRFEETFSVCRDMIQVGYMVIAPRDVAIDEDSSGRISHGPSALQKLRPFERIVLLYDRFGYLNLIRSQEPSHVHDFGKLLSSDGFYDDEACRYGENRSYPARSLSCELWAVTISAFDGAAIYLRDVENNAPLVWGDGTRTSPAVLVIRKRENKPLQAPPDVDVETTAEVPDHTAP